VGTRTGLDDDVERRNFCSYQDSNSDSSVVQPVASCSTECFIPAPLKIYVDASKCIYVSQDVCKCLRLYIPVSNLVQVYHTTRRCLTLFVALKINALRGYSVAVPSSHVFLFGCVQIYDVELNL
jgi:hypothetical protein